MFNLSGFLATLVLANASPGIYMDRHASSRDKNWTTGSSATVSNEKSLDFQALSWSRSFAAERAGHYLSVIACDARVWSCITNPFSVNKFCPITNGQQ